MNKNIIKTLFAASAILALSSCERYLDEPQPTNQVSTTLAFSNTQNAEANLTGIISFFRKDNVSVNPDAANLGSVYFARENRGTTVITPASWFNPDYQTIARLTIHRRSSWTWNYFYKMIRQTNEFIAGVESSTGIADSDKKSLIARAKVVRAIAYFELLQDFQHGYNYAKNQPALPIYGTYSRTANPFSTTEEVYTFITDDLESALEDLPSSRVSKNFINLQVGQAIAARVYQVKGDWAKAAQYANLAYGGNTDTALDANEYAQGFKELNSKEWIFGYGQNSSQTITWNIAPHSFTDLSLVNDGYSSTFVSEDLYNMFSDTDVRKLFDVNPNISNFRKYSTHKFTFNKDVSAAPYIRTSEMILIEAEALYHTNPTAAHNLLYALQQNRDPQAVKSSNTGNALFEEILKERVKELYGEIGVEVYDAKRLSRPYARSSFHQIPLSFSANDIRLIYQYPQQEIDANPNINASINANR